MITNERQYRAAKTQLERFALAVEQFDERAAVEAGIDPLIARAQGEGLREQLRELRREVAAYEGLSQGGPKAFAATSIMQIPPILIKARIASGLSQRALAERVGLKEQQVQRYEAERYQGASLARLHQISNALSLKWQLKAESGAEQVVKTARIATTSAGAEEPSKNAPNPKPAAAKPVLTVRKASRADIPALVLLSKRFAAERGPLGRFDVGYAYKQINIALIEDMTFIAFAGDDPAGAIICRSMDVGYRRLNSFETTHIFILRDQYSLRVLSALLDAVDEAAHERGVTVLVNQLDYAAVTNAGVRGQNTSPVEAQARSATEPQIERIVVHPQTFDFDVEEEEEVASPSSRRARSSSSRSSD